MTTGKWVPATGKSLSPRERQVIQLYADGYSGPRIGDRLGISKYTVQIHLDRIRKKLGARNRVHAAVLWALRA